MSNNLTLSDAINAAQDTGKNATFLYNGTLYTFSAQGLIDFLTAEGNFGGDVPDPLEIDELIVNSSWSLPNPDVVGYAVEATPDGLALRTRTGGTEPTLSIGHSDEDALFEASVTQAGVLNIDMIGLPTVDPAVAGRLWSDANVLKISTGP